MTRMKKITLEELAAELGLTKHTVSKALRGLPGMSEETRRIVVEHAADRGYQTRQDKKRLTGWNPHGSADTRIYRFLFVVVSDTGQENETHHLLFQGVQERAVSLGHTVMMVFLPGYVQSDAQFEQWADQNKIAHADGLFITPNTPEFLEQRLLDLQNPRIMLNFPPPSAKVDSVIWDVYDATQTAVYNLVDKGHRRIMYIGDVGSTRGYGLRWHAFSAAMRESGLEADPQSHLLEGDQELAKLSEHFLERFRKIRPTALISSSYADLKWIYYAIGTLGLRIPDDCSLVTVSTSPFSVDVARPLFLMKKSGSRSVDQMIWRIAHPDDPYERVTLASHYHEGTTISKICSEVTTT
jgi:LacI family transcriptional regulator